MNLDFDNVIDPRPHVGVLLRGLRLYAGNSQGDKVELRKGILGTPILEEP